SFENFSRNFSRCSISLKARANSSFGLKGLVIYAVTEPTGTAVFPAMLSRGAAQAKRSENRRASNLMRFEWQCSH
ncbi:MAG: hypothetical protein KH370_08025, partial [Collinsella intestinalis]|nr:hypothetical protein [Collinsella intestinalis]